MFRGTGVWVSSIVCTALGRVIPSKVIVRDASHTILNKQLPNLGSEATVDHCDEVFNTSSKGATFPDHRSEDTPTYPAGLTTRLYSPNAQNKNASLHELASEFLFSNREQRRG